MLNIIFATHNDKKVLEAKSILKDHFEVLSLAELDFHEDIEETGLTFHENAAIKARFINARFNLPCFADDSGLEVFALNRAPGIYSARYAAIPKDDDKNNTLLLENLKSHKNRLAQFTTVIAFAFSENDVHYFEGNIEGCITSIPKGSNGFGYDPLFIPKGFDQTFAEMPTEQKNDLSHRSIALKKMSDFLKSRSL
jgi:XTP/dITP diphosphohydrolase